MRRGGPRTGPRNFGAVLLGAALLLVAGCRRPSLDGDVADLLRGPAGDRLAAGRFSTAVDPAWHLEHRPDVGQGPLLTSQDVARVLSRLRGEGLGPAEELAASGLADLARGEVDRAVLDFRAAVAEAPERAGLHADLAAVYLHRAEVTDSPLDLVAALAAVDSALERDPRHPAARFNKALVLEGLGLHLQAAEAWQDFIGRPDTAPWESEARQRLADLESTADLVARWRQAKSSSQDIVALVEAFPYRSRVWGEEDLLGAWASAEGDDAREILETLRGLGAALERQRGEGVLARCVRTIDDSGADADGSALEGLRRGHRDFAAALEPYAVQDLDTARPLFESARRRLAEAPSPLHLWADFYLAVLDYYSNTEAATAKLQDLDRRLEGEPFQALRGRVHWLLGTIESVVHRPESALEHYRTSFEVLESSSGRFGSLFVHVLLAGAFSTLGEVEVSWRHRLEALRGLAVAGDPRRRHSGLNEASLALIREGKPRLAEYFLDELAANARDWGNANALTEAYLQRSRNRLTRGAFTAAAEDLRRARAAWNDLPESKLRRHLDLSLLLEEARASLGDAPEIAISALTDAIKGQQDIGYGYHHITALTARAGAHLRLEQRAAAEADLLAAIEVYEAVRAEVTAPELRVRAFRSARPAFDTYLEVGAGAAEPEADRLLEIAERSRARFLADLGSRDHESSSDFRQALDLLPEDARVVEYAVLPDRLLIWAGGRTDSETGGLERRGLRMRGLRMHQVEVTAARLGELVDRIRLLLERGAPEAELTEPGAELWRHLLEPVADLVEGEGPLVFVPDPPLHRLPFALLAAPSGRFLLEDRTFSVVPSLAVLARSLRPRHAPSSGAAASVLAVGRPTVDGERFPGLENLPGAEEEAHEVAAFYASARVLTGGDATEKRFLEALRSVDVVHFAGHALGHPEAFLRSRLLLAPAPGSDGILTGSELLEQPLDGPRLVVLSACDTMAGSEQDREGQLGLAGLFIAAGVPSVVASLWPINDRETRALMTELHRHLGTGMPPHQALRRAALDRRAEGATPQAWSAFQVVGGPLPAVHPKPQENRCPTASRSTSQASASSTSWPAAASSC